MRKILEDQDIINCLHLENSKDFEISNWNRLDFPEIYIQDLATAITLAYEKGYADGIQDHIRNGQ